MNWFLILLLIAVGLLFVYEGFMLVRAIIKRHKAKNSTSKTHNSIPLRKE